MKILKILYTVIAVMLFCGLQVRAEQPGFELEAVSAIGSGAVAYELSAGNIFGSIKSRLEFPLDGVYAGVEGVYNSGVNIGGVENISFGVRLLTNLTDPDDDMNDFDWWNGALVGDTDSEAEAKSFSMDLFIRTDVVYRPDFILSGIAGFRYEDYQFDIYGLDGYYLPPLGDGSHVSVDYGIKVLTYDMTHNLFYGGLEGRVIMTDSITAVGKMTLGIGWADDRDDHILRSKISKGEYVTLSADVSGYLIWYLSPADAAAGFYLKAGVEAYGMAGSGEQDQVFEDGSASFYGIDVDLDLAFVSGRAMLGCTF